MRQSIDLNRKKEQRGAVVTVMFHGSVWRFGDSLSALPSQFRSSKPRVRALHSLYLVDEAVAPASHPLLEAEWLHTFVVGRAEQSKISLRILGPQMTAFQVEGISNSSCDYVACIPTIQNPEQRCCAAA